MKLILNNLSGDINDNQIGEYDDDVCMMKYNELCIAKL